MGPVPALVIGSRRRTSGQFDLPTLGHGKFGVPVPVLLLFISSGRSGRVDFNLYPHTALLIPLGINTLQVLRLQVVVMLAPHIFFPPVPVADAEETSDFFQSCVAP
jgi:hypothetical protein